MKIRKLIIKECSDVFTKTRWQWVYVELFNKRNFSARYEYNKKHNVWVWTGGENEIVSPTDHMLTTLFNTFYGRLLLNEDGSIDRKKTFL